MCLSNGEEFYPAELAAIAAAEQTIHLEAFIFRRGEVAEKIHRRPERASQERRTREGDRRRDRELSNA